MRNAASMVRDELDPALLALVKCHITSFSKWEVLRALADRVDFWTEPGDLCRQVARPVDKIREAINQLAREGIVEGSQRAGVQKYRLPLSEPTTVVVQRLMGRASKSQDLRLIIVAHILQGNAGTPAMSR